MSITQYHIQEFMEYFSGSQHKYGKHIYDAEIEEGKRKGKSWTVTDKLLTIEEYSKHLKGEEGLGIIPIDENNKCKFTVIDIDLYDINYNIYLRAIDKQRFPLIPFKSKSGGIHLYMFFKEYVKATSAIEIMRKLSFLLAVDILVKQRENRVVEIFPKQTKIQKGDIGSWINIPYYNAQEPFTYAIKGDKKLNFNEALMHIKEKTVSLQEAETFVDDLPYHDAPPCLQTIHLLNPLSENSGRNNYLFSFGVYLKKKDEDFFETNLKEINDSLDEPLKEHELEKTVLNSLRKKDYLYKCKESPCISFCNKKRCREREYGIGKEEGYFSNVEVGQLYQYKIAQPYYEWEVRIQGQDTFKKLRFKSEEEIIKQDAFLKLCMRELHELPSKLKQMEWFKKVNAALKEIEVIQVSEEDDTSPIMILKSMIQEFCTSRKLADDKEHILLGKVYFNLKSREYYFRIKDLNDYIYVNKSFRYFTPQELHGILREMECISRKITIGKKQVRVSALPIKSIQLATEYEEYKPSFDQYREAEF